MVRSCARSVGAERNRNDSAPRRKVCGNKKRGYTAENGSITASSPQFSQLSFTARKQTCLVQLSNELIMDANVAVEANLRSHITKYLAID